MITFAMAMPGTLRERMWFVFLLFDTSHGVNASWERRDFYNLLKLVNNAAYCFGDRKLVDTQLNDLVDSIYTMAGKIDGPMDFSNFFGMLLQHPLVELFISIQFQNQLKTEKSD